MVFKCSLPGCSNTSHTTKMHCLPKDPEWCNVVRRLDLEDVSDRKRHNFRVCDVHFAADAKFPAELNRPNLKYDAVPTLCLEGITEDTSNVDLEVPGIFEKIPEETQYIVSEHSYSRSKSPQLLAVAEAAAYPGHAVPSSSAAPDSPIEPTPSTSDAPVTPIHKGPRGDSSSRTNLLRTAGVTRAINLTPKARKLYEVAKDLKKVARRLDFQNASNRERLAEAIRYAETPNFLHAGMNARSLNFINCQLKMQQKNARGRRFTFEDKVFALSLLKQGPKAYKVLRSTFALPARKTLMNMLNKIHFNVGIVPKVMEVLKGSCEKLSILEKYCALMFDEISIEPSLTYDRKWDEIVGFQNIDGEKTLKYVDHALVFMLRGLRKKWKQPISFHFSEGGMTSDQLKILIKKTILSLQETGFIVICTVCDQYSANVNAIKKLKEESSSHSASDLDLFEIGGQEIVAVYDPPHLIKGMRNNLAQNDLKFCRDETPMKANWNDIVSLYELDEGDFNTKMCYKLTDSHVYKEKLKKMKVKHAAQVFSHRVSSTMRWTAKHGREGVMPKSSEGTATLLSFMDQIFDSVNGSSYEADHGKLLRSAVKEGSEHIKFWEDSIKVFQSMKFLTPRGETVPPTVKNWIKTLRGFIHIWRKLSSAGFKYLCTRNINQDPIENFFGCIRSHGVRNINPTCYSFIASFKSLIISNFASPHSPGANCEEDNNEVLNSLTLLLTGEEETNVENTSEDDDGSIEFENIDNSAIISTHSYIAGYIARKIKKNIGNCTTCINQMQASSSSEEHSLILEREYKSGTLVKPKTQFRRMFTNMVLLFAETIKKRILRNSVGETLSAIFKKKLFNPFLCEIHNVFDLYIDFFLTFFMYTYLKNMNSILKGRVAHNIKDNDILKKLAAQRHIILKSKNKKIVNTKQLT